MLKVVRAPDHLLRFQANLCEIIVGEIIVGWLVGWLVVKKRKRTHKYQSGFSSKSSSPGIAATVRNDVVRKRCCCGLFNVACRCCRWSDVRVNCNLLEVKRVAERFIFK